MTGTTPGVIMGTVGYMSPEQASGAAVDFRTDQFSFGSILYELVTGERAFQGKTAIDVLGAILNGEPEPIAEISPQTPTPLRWIIERCLSKDPRQRYSSTEDLARDLATLRDHLSEATSGGELAASRPRRRLVPWLALGAAALAIAAMTLLRPRPPVTELHAIRFSIRPPANGGFHGFAFSPDGMRLAFISAPRGEPPRIWLRPLSAADARPMPGTENVDWWASPFWSPDGHSVGFFTAGKLWRLDASGGVPVPVCDVPICGPWENLSYAGSWGADGEILFATRRGEAIYRVSTSEGKPVAIVKPDRARGETKVLWPWFLPDGRSFLYLRQETSASSLMLVSGDRPPRPLFPMLSRVEYVQPGYLVFVRDGTLLGQRFDPRSGQLSGEPRSIADSVGYSLRNGWATFASSRGGALAVENRSVPGRRIVLIDRAGSPQTLASTGGGTGVAFDPDGRRALFARMQPKTRTHNLWILDLERKVEARVTSDPADEYDGRWLPDGKSIVYTAQRGGMVQLCRRELATGREKALLPAGEFQSAEAVMPGGAQLAYSNETDQGTSEMRLVSLSGDQKSSPLFQTGFNQGGVRFSPDGRFIAFASDDSGRDEIYVASIARPGERTRFSFGGALGSPPLWSHDGSGIFYLSLERQLMSVPVRTSPSLSPGNLSVLFTLKDGASWEAFDVSPDGKRFIAVVSEGIPEPVPLNLILNWTAEAVTQGSSAR
jgi:Tol biopolymer transport system component